MLGFLHTLVFLILKASPTVHLERNPMMNLAALIQLKDAWNSFKTRHPKFPLFTKAVCEHSLAEGTVIEIKVTAPDGKVMNSNLKLRKEDLELIRYLNELLP